MRMRRAVKRSPGASRGPLPLPKVFWKTCFPQLRRFVRYLDPENPRSIRFATGRQRFFRSVPTSQHQFRSGISLKSAWNHGICRAPFAHANQRNELDDGGGISPARRPRGIAVGQHRTTRISEPEHRQHFGRTARCRSIRAAGRSCVSGALLRDHAVFSRVSGNHHVAGTNLHVGHA